MRKFGVLRFPAKLNQERCGHSRTALAGAMGSKAAQAYVCLRCADAATQVSGAGFDGWVMLLRDHFDTEDQAWPQEKLRLEGTARHVRKPPKAFMIIPPSLPVPTIRDTPQSCTYH